MNVNIEKQNKLIFEFKVIYEEISGTYHNDRFSNKWGVYDYTETNCLLDEIMDEYNIHIQDSYILDVACGTGKVSIPLAIKGGNVFCLDASPGMLNECLKRAIEYKCEANITLINASANKLPEIDNKYDLVVSTRFLHLFPIQMYPMFIKEMLRVVKPSGYVIVEIKNRYYGGFINLRNELVKKFSGGTPSSSMTISQIRKSVQNYGNIVAIKGCSLPKGQNVPHNSKLSMILRSLSRTFLRGITLSSYVVIRKKDED